MMLFDAGRCHMNVESPMRPSKEKREWEDGRERHRTQKDCVCGVKHVYHVIFNLKEGTLARSLTEILLRPHSRALLGDHFVLSDVGRTDKPTPTTSAHPNQGRCFEAFKVTLQSSSCSPLMNCCSARHIAKGACTTGHRQACEQQHTAGTRTISSAVVPYAHRGRKRKH